MLDVIKEIIVAMIENNYISNSNDDDKNIENINNAIKKIAKQISDVNHSKFN